MRHLFVAKGRDEGALRARTSTRESDALPGRRDFVKPKKILQWLRSKTPPSSVTYNDIAILSEGHLGAIKMLVEMLDSPGGEGRVQMLIRTPNTPRGERLYKLLLNRRDGRGTI